MEYLSIWKMDSITQNLHRVSKNSFVASICCLLQKINSFPLVLSAWSQAGNVSKYRQVNLLSPPRPDYVEMTKYFNFIYRLICLFFTMLLRSDYLWDILFIEKSFVWQSFFYIPRVFESFLPSYLYPQTHRSFDVSMLVAFLGFSKKVILLFVEDRLGKNLEFL